MVDQAVRRTQLEDAMSYLDFSPLVDTALIVALAFIVWGAYRELRGRKVRDAANKEIYLD